MAYTDGPGGAIAGSNLLWMDTSQGATETQGTSNAAGDATMSIQSDVATAGTNGPPEQTRPSMAKAIMKGLASCVMKIPLLLFNGACACMRGSQTEGRLDMEGNRPQRYFSNDDSAPLDVTANLNTLDGMTAGGIQFSDEIKELMAESPTLMTHLNDFAKAGWTLALGEGEEFDNMPLRTRFHDKDQVVFLSEDKMLAEPEAFLDEFVGLMMINKDSMMSPRQGGGDQITNIEVELPNVRAEIAANLAEANAA